VSQFDGLSKRSGKSQKEGQKDYKHLQTARGVLPSSVFFPWSYWTSFWLFPGLPDNPSNWFKLKPALKAPKGT
jgi:hypothetical protein